MAVTDDPNDPRLTRGPDAERVEQAEVYLVLSEDERKKGFLRPVRRSYQHTKCMTVTKMNQQIAETYARDPHFYGSTYCMGCARHLPVDEFVWMEQVAGVPTGHVSDERVGS